MASLSALNRRIAKLEASFAKNDPSIVDVEWLSDSELRIGKKVMSIEDTAKEFIANDKDTFVLVMGPFRSGKTTMSCAKIIANAMKMPKNKYGERVSRAVIVRNTYGELMSTTRKSWNDWADIPRISHREKPYPESDYKFRDKDGVVKLQVIYLALDQEKHIRKLLSLEATMFYFNELSCVLLGIVSTAIDRLCYPPKNSYSEEYIADCEAKGLPLHHSCVIADTNPPTNRSWIYKKFEQEKPKGWKIYKQPPGLLKTDEGYIKNPDAENVANLPNLDYYINMVNSHNDEYLKVYACGEYGVIRSGKPVYPQYNEAWHSVDTIEPIDGVSIDLGWDFGLTPSVLCTQTTSDGRLLCLREICAERMGLKNFLPVFFKIFKEAFPGHKVGYSVADPAGRSAAQTDEQACIEILNDAGIYTEGSSVADNCILQRLEAAWQMLNLSPNGQPGVLVSREGCPILHDGFVSEYKFEKANIANEEIYKDVPAKNSYSHIHDAFQYVAIRHLEGVSQSNQEPVEVPMSIGGFC